MSSPASSIHRVPIVPVKLLPLAFIALSQTLLGDVIIANNQSTTALAYAGSTSASDLINSGQPTLASASVSPSNGTFPGSGINDGVYANSPFAANTFFDTGVNFPATAVYDLNLTSSPNGYDITSIDSFMGWATVARKQANQNFTVEVRTVGSAGYEPLAYVNYTPFSGSGGNYETRVTVTDSSGVLARGVDSIRFIFGDPGTEGTIPQGTVIREIDVAGTPSATAPAIPAIHVQASNSSVDGVYASEISSTDLVNAGQASLASMTSVPAPQFGAGGQNDGVYGLANLTAASWYHPAVSMPATLSFELNTATSPAGYEISAIRSYAGWKAGGTQCYANQKYSVEYRTVGSSTWVALKSVDYSPFSSLTNTPANSKVVLSSPSGLLATGVAALRFNFVTPTRADGANNGTVLQELDVIGQAVGTTPAGITLSTPAQRQILQRGAGGTAGIPISGTYLGTPDIIEARAVVMAGTNSGTTTPWQTIVAAPSGASFTGTLPAVAAGGWYQVEVRSVSAGVPSPVASVAKVGVGDIYVTAGQSNAANDGGPAYTPVDDRVSVRTAASGNTWRHGFDPVPVATGGGGSVWSRLGDQLVAADNIPVGFLCVAVGATETAQWLPGTSNYTDRLKPAVQSFPAGGFRALLWHQGESDSIANTSAATYASRMASIIGQTRTDAAWSIPWYLAEASFHPATYLSQEEPVAAGQRMAIHADPLVFFGASTDSFHLEDAAGGKLADTVHFNATGLAAHASQWRDILRGTTTPAPRNGDFEDNRNPAITGLTPLADGALHIVNTTSDTDSPSVIGWRILTADGLNAATGSNGFHNPGASTYAAAVDSINGGVMPEMAGRHVAVLNSGAAGNFFLHSTRVSAAADTIYRLKVALGIRDNPAIFGGARLDILANGQVVATGSFDKAALDVLRGSDAAGHFTSVQLSYSTAASVTPDQSLAIRIAKTGGAGTVLDFDNVRFSAVPLGYEGFQIEHWGSDAVPESARALDPDGDGIPNVIEYFIGADPRNATPLPQPVLVAGGTLARWIVPLDPGASGPGFELQYSHDLESWQPAASSGDGTIISTRTAISWTLEVDISAHPRTWFRLSAP